VIVVICTTLNCKVKVMRKNRLKSIKEIDRDFGLHSREETEILLRADLLYTIGRNT